MQAYSDPVIVKLHRDCKRSQLTWTYSATGDELQIRSKGSISPSSKTKGERPRVRLRVLSVPGEKSVGLEGFWICIQFWIVKEFPARNSMVQRRSRSAR